MSWIADERAVVPVRRRSCSGCACMAPGGDAVSQRLSGRTKEVLDSTGDAKKVTSSSSIAT